MSDGSDPYLDPGTGVLRNVPGLKDAGQLAAFETSTTAQRSYELLRRPADGAFDTAHLKAIHQYLFQDVFTWAGQFRTTMLGKAESFGRPPTWFTPPHLLEHEAGRIFGLLHAAGLLRGLGQVEFAHQAARLLGEINKLHPFREGNGRTQRLSPDALARQAGHQLHYFDVITRERMIQASIRANNGSVGMMTRMFEEIADVSRIQPVRRAIAFLSREKFNWNDTYIATTTAGESYAGKLVGRDAGVFMMRSDDDRIFVGRRGDIDRSIRIGERIAFRAS
jgi:cell filamentation protein, protein adenylyltransferase